jgi:hypothetical protein
MLLTTAISLLSGAVLGLSFNVWILASAMVLPLAALAFLLALTGHGFGAVLLTVVFAASGLQFGYLAGAFLRLAIERRRAVAFATLRRHHRAG